MKTAKRGNIPAFRIMEALRDANQIVKAGGSVVHLSLGQPSQEVPAKVLARLAERMPSMRLGYTDSTGIIELRERIVRHYKECYGLDVPIERVFVTLGSSAAFLLAMLASFDAGDELAIALPCYPAYPNMMKSVDVAPVYLRGTPENKFQPNVSLMQALPRKPQGLVIASPSNPTGTVLEDAEIKQLAGYCEQNDIRIISDEIYHGITFGKQAQTVLAHTDTAFVVNSFSKLYLMPGWRIGWAVVPADLVKPFEALVQNLFISPSAIAQYAALDVFDCVDELAAVVKTYETNRAILLEELPKAGFSKLAPAEGGFFVYADVSALTNDSEAFCRRMLHETGVVSVSGLDFDPEEGNRYVRFSFSGSQADMKDAMRRLREWKYR